MRTEGFTLVEMLVTISLIAVIAGFSMIVSMDLFRGSTFRQDRALLISTLQRARSLSQNNVCSGTCSDGSAHGVAILPDAYVLFQGPDYAHRDVAQDDVLQASPSVQRTGVDEIVFAQVSAASVGGTISLAEGTIHTSDISVDHNGRISWTH